MLACKKWSSICPNPLLLNSTSNNKKFVQFVIILYLLTHGRPMTNFHNVKFLLNLLKVEHYPKKHQYDNVTWGVVEALHSIIMQATKLALDKAKVFALSCVEVILVDNQS